MPSNPHQEPISDLLKKIVARFWGKQDALAEAIGVDGSTVNRWVKGSRSPGADDLHLVLSATLAGRDEDRALVADWLVEKLIGKGLKVESLTPDTTPRDWHREQAEGMTVEADMARAVLDEDLEAFDVAAEKAVEELRQRIEAGRQKITGSADSAPRLIKGARP